MKLEDVVPHWVRDRYDREIISARYEFTDPPGRITLTVRVTLDGCHCYVTTLGVDDHNGLKRTIGIKVNGNLLVSDPTEKDIRDPGLQWVTLRLEDIRTFYKEELELWDLTNNRPIELLPENGNEPQITLKAVLKRIEVLSCFVSL